MKKAMCMLGVFQAQKGWCAWNSVRGEKRREGVQKQSVITPLPLAAHCRGTGFNEAEEIPSVSLE